MEGGNKLSAGQQGDLSWACSHDNGMARGPLMQGQLCPTWTAGLVRVCSSHRRAARGSRGRVGTSEASRHLARFRFKHFYPRPLARTGHVATPKVKRWEVHSTHGEAVAGVWVQAGTKKWARHSVHPSEPSGFLCVR